MTRAVALSLALLFASGADGFAGPGLIRNPSLKLACRTSATRRVFPAGRSRDPAERLLYRASSHDCECSRVEEEQKNQVGASVAFLAAALLSCAYLTVRRKIDT